jgi:decaprenylphospho-beta-D-erythro-pentofuranosid-2-ulose 2-reductase
VIDALGSPQSVLLLGGTSEIALAILDALPPGRITRVVLVGRDRAALDVAAGRVPGGAMAEVVLCDATDTAAHRGVIDAIFAAGDIDVTVLAIGALGDQDRSEAEPELAVELARSTFVGPLSLILHTGRGLRAQGHGDLVVLSSVAGRQARRANYVYGSAKAGLDLAALGLGDSLYGYGPHVLVVRPGFVHTRMTAHLPPAPFAVSPQAVAAAVTTGLRRRRAVVYSPPLAAAISAALVVLPRAVLRRLPF